MSASQTPPPTTTTSSPTIPQFAAALLVGYLVFRFFFKSSSPPSAAGGVSGGGGVPARPPAVDRQRLTGQVAVVHGMFPQFSEAAIEAELIRNGGSIEIATERILANGFLPEPPGTQRPAPSPASSGPVSGSAPSPRPQPPAPAPAARPPAPTGRRPVAGGSRPMVQAGYTDLVTRYNLHARLAEPVEAAAVESKGKGKAPATKDARMMAHKEKRDMMIIEARRRVEKMIAEGKL